MPKAIRVHTVGGPDVMMFEECDPGEPGPGQILIEQAAAGVNYIDVYFRTGLYKSERSPFILGREGAGTVTALGDGVEDFAIGDRVAYAVADGTYAERVVVDAKVAIKLPDAIGFESAAAVMLKGMTAEYLLRRTYPVGAGTVMLFHAAAGGVGLIAGQWAKHLGATVIGTAGGPQKCALARENGYDHVIDYNREDFAARVLEITEGQKCDVVYDSVGKDTFLKSLDCLKPRGLWVSFGQASGKLPDIDLAILAQKGSLFATRPTLFSYVATRAELEASAQALFGVMTSDAVTIRIDQRFALKDAADAHRALEARTTTGTTILTI